MCAMLTASVCVLTLPTYSSICLPPGTGIDVGLGIRRGIGAPVSGLRATACTLDGSLSLVRVFIMSDMEGVAGVTKWAETTGGEALHAERSRLYTEEINAAVRGAFNGGATEVVVMDCHGAGERLDVQLADPRPARPALRLRRAAGVDASTRTSSSRAATPRCSSACTRWRGRPTACSTTPSRAPTGATSRFNGTLVGETGINAALCGTWGCPVLLVTGDEAVCREAHASCSATASRRSPSSRASAASARATSRPSARAS